MSTDRETTRVVRSWLEEGVTRLPDRVLDEVLDQVPATPQRRSGWSAWRSFHMNTYAKLAAGVAALALVAVVGYQLLPGHGGIGGPPTIAPSPSPALLARGTFKAVGYDTTLDATGAGANVHGTLRVAKSAADPMTVDLQCEKTTNGLLFIGGDVTDASADLSAAAGTRAGILLKPGSPVEAIFVFQFEDPRAASCLAFLDEMAALGDVDSAVEPIEGTVELRP
jgi:hypothetical protein